MTTPSSTTGEKPAPLGYHTRWLRGASALTLAGLVVALGGYPLGRLAAGRGSLDAMAALIDPPVPGLTVALRMALLVALALSAGIALARLALGGAPVPAGVLVLARIAGTLGAAVCVVEALTGQAARGLCALLVSATLLLPTRRPVAIGLLTLLGLALASVLAVELAILRTGLPRAVDAGYAVLGSVLLGVSVFGIAVLPHRPGRPVAAEPVLDAVVEPVAEEPGPGRELVSTRLAGIALVSGVLTALAGVVQLALSGPRTWFDLLHTGYGVGAITQAVMPVLVTLMWLLARQPAGRFRGAELSRLATGLLVLAFLAGASLASLPQPAVGPESGQPLLRPVDLGLRHLAVLVMPMRPGPNLVHIGDAGGGQLVEAGHRHGASASAPVSSILTIGAGGAPVSLASRLGAPGQWAVLDIPAGTPTLTVTGDGMTAGIPIDVGSAPADPAVQRVLAGPDGPECAGVALGALAAGRTPTQGCPSQRLTAKDADVLGDAVDFLAQRGITTLDLAADGSPRAVAAEALVRTDAAQRGLTIAAAPAADHTLFVVSGWSAGADALSALSLRAGDGAFGGVVLAPWLFSAPVLAATTSEVLPLTFDPRRNGPREYATTLAAAFPGETPSEGGYLAWTGETGAAGPLKFYGAAQVNVPMDDMDMGSGPSSWYPAGTIVPISPAVNPPHTP
jgi:hypothetical protein